MCTAAFVCFSLKASAEESAPYFSNKDIEQYRKSPDAVPGKTGKAVQEERKTAAKAAREGQEAWCKRARAQKKKIAQAQYDLDKAKKDLSAAKEKDFRGNKKSTRLQDRVERAKQRLSDEEQEMNDLEDEARRKSIPPGWLRCQFD